MPTPIPTELKRRRKSRLLAVTFDSGEHFDLPFEYLRVFSPSAEVRGHGGEPFGLPKVLVYGKENVEISQVEPVGNYAVRLVFDDGHDSGLFTWQMLYELGKRFEDNWPQYLARLEKAGIDRHTD